MGLCMIKSGLGRNGPVNNLTLGEHPFTGYGNVFGGAEGYKKF